MKKSIFDVFILLLIFTYISCYKFYDNNDYSFKATYRSDSENESVPLIQKLPGEIIKMVIDDEEVEPCITYTFSKAGIHTVSVLN